MRLAELRKSLGVPQTELARRVGTDQRQISRIENGDDLLYSSLTRYLHGLGVELELRVKIVGEDPVTVEVGG